MSIARGARRRVLLVNPNRMLPPIAPIGLEYAAASLKRHGYDVVPCDLTFARDWPQALTDSIEATKPSAVLVSIRNIDDAYFAGQDFVLETSAMVIRTIRRLVDVPVILGGVGFSIAPREILAFTGAQYGIVGDSEDALPRLLECLASGGEVSGVLGIAFVTDDGTPVAMPPAASVAVSLPAPPERLFDLTRYFTEGGQVGVETKRGCAGACIYCVEPAAKGRTKRLRRPESVAGEFASLIERGLYAIHLCDSEFNLPPDHARAVCAAIARPGLGDRVRWYTYACPEAFDADLARAMARAGCVGVNFGVDHFDEGMLRRLGRPYGPSEIRAAVNACRKAGLAVMLDMLLGGPGETHETLARAIELARAMDPDCVGLSCGVRVYPHTPLARMVHAQGSLDANPHLQGRRTGNGNLLRPIFYVESALGEGIHETVSELVGGDKRFFHADPRQLEGNYNYNDNTVLSKAIRDGARGAYWDILRRL